MFLFNLYLLLNFCFFNESYIILYWCLFSVLFMFYQSFFIFISWTLTWLSPHKDLLSSSWFLLPSVWRRRREVWLMTRSQWLITTCDLKTKTSADRQETHRHVHVFYPDSPSRWTETWEHSVFLVFDTGLSDSDILSSQYWDCFNTHIHL